MKRQFTGPVQPGLLQKIASLMSSTKASRLPLSFVLFAAGISFVFGYAAFEDQEKHIKDILALIEIKGQEADEVGAILKPELEDALMAWGPAEKIDKATLAHERILLRSPLSLAEYNVFSLFLEICFRSSNMRGIKYPVLRHEAHAVIDHYRTEVDASDVRCLTESPL